MKGQFSPSVTAWFDNQVNDENICISVINKIELLGFNATPQNSKDLQDLVDSVEILSLTDAIVNETIALRKIKKIKLADAIIAATAIVHNLTIISRNTVDFKNIAGLTCLDPYSDI